MRKLIFKNGKLKPFSHNGRTVGDSKRCEDEEEQDDERTILQQHDHYGKVYDAVIVK